MKRRLLIFFGIMACWMSGSYAQVPEILYYKFEDSVSVINEAASPEGINPVLVHDSLKWDLNGLDSSGALTGSGVYVPGGGVHTGWKTRINGSFTIGFWYRPPVDPGAGILFSDSLLNLNCMVSKQGNIFLLVIPPTVFPQTFTLPIPATYPHMIHFVYNEAAATFTVYVDGIQNVQASVPEPIDVTGSNLTIGNSTRGSELPMGFVGTIDEFRWYDRALTTTEMINTGSIDLNTVGNCPSFTGMQIDSISGTAMKLHWVPGANSTSYHIEYDTAGFAPGTGTLVSGAYPTDSSEVIISGLMPETEYDIYFSEICSSNDSVYNKAPYTIPTTELCQKASGLKIPNITESSADLQWDFIGPSQEFYLIYGFNGFDPATSGKTDTVYGLSHTLTGLSYGAFYEVYLIPNCGGNNGYGDTISKKFITDCPIFSAPFFEDFEDSTWVPESDFFGNGDTINACWNRWPEDHFSWGIREGGPPDPNSRHTPVSGNGGVGKYVITRAIGTGDNIDTAEMYTPVIDVSSLSNPYMSFYYHRNGTGQPDIIVEINDGTGWTNIMTLVGSGQSLKSDPYKKTGVNISSFGDTVQIRIKAIKIDVFSTMGLDDFEINEAPQAVCMDAAKVISIGSDKDTSVAIKLEPEDYQFNFELGPVGFIQGSGCLGFGSSLDTIDDCISLNSVYDLYVQSNCQDSGLGVSSWTGPYKLCSPFTAPYSNNFDENESSDCWQVYSKAASGVLFQGAVVYDNYSLGLPGETLDEKAFSGEYTLRLYDDNISEGDTILSMSPRFIDLPEGNKQIRFLAKTRVDLTEPGKIIVGTVNSYTEGSSFDPIDTLILHNEWQEFIIELDPLHSSYNGVHQIIAFKLGENIEACDIDDFHYEDVPACKAPDLTSIHLDFVTATSALINWDKREELSVEVVWGVPGFSPDEGGLGTGNTMDSFYMISNLIPGSSYELYLLGNCNRIDTPWVGPVSFSTLKCDVITAPVFENFDHSNWFSPSRSLNPFNRGDVLDSCWSRSVRTSTRSPFHVFQAYSAWGVQNGTDFTTTGPSQDHSGNGNFIYTIPIYAEIGEIADFYSPWIDISNLNRPYLSFYYHRFGRLLPEVAVQVNDGSGWMTKMTFMGQDQAANTDPFRKAGIDLSAYRDTVQVRFRSTVFGYSQIGETAMAIDDFSVGEMSDCLHADSLQVRFEMDTANGIWTTGLSWSDGNNDAPGTTYEVWFGPKGFLDHPSLGPGTRVIVQDSHINIDSLIPAQCYEYLVRTICSSGDTGEYSYPLPFCVPCSPVNAPFTESFNVLSLTENASCWKQKLHAQDELRKYQWKAIAGPSGTGFTTGTNSGFSGLPNDNYLFTQTTGNNGDIAELYSPIIYIRPLARPQLYFGYHMFGRDIDTLRVDIFDGIQWHNDVWHLYGQQQTGSNSPWKDTIISLSSFAGNQFIQVRYWTKRIGGGGEIAIDEFRIMDSLTCPFPEDFRVKNRSGNQVVLEWNASPDNQSYILEYGPSGFIRGQGTEQIISTDSIIINLPNSNRIYDVYLRVNCGGGDSSLTVGPLRINLEVKPCDDMEAYDSGPIIGQSSLFHGWDDDSYIGNPAYNFVSSGGDAEISTVNALSGTKALRIHNTGPNKYSDIAAVFEDISSGIYQVSFSFLTGDNIVGQYDLQTTSGINSSEYDNIYCYLDSSGTATVREIVTQTVLGYYSFNPVQWTTVNHVVDFDRDTAWIIVNSSHAHIGWNFSLGRMFAGLQLDGVNFYSVQNQNSTSDFYIDDFCVTPYTCPQPASFNLDNAMCTQAMISWIEGVGGATAVVEYDTSGFTRGSGIRSISRTIKDTLTGLTPGRSYDVYVGEVCGYDTVFTGPLTFTLPTEAVADFTFTKDNPNLAYLEVTFDGGSSIAASAYKWDFGDGSTDSVVAPVHTYTQNGTYTVRLIIDSDCGRDTIVKTVEISGISLKESLLSQSLEVYPNPFENSIRIDFETGGTADAVIRITDLSGKTVVKQILSDINGKYSGELILDHLSGGTYMLRVESGENQAVHKIVKH